jgi:integrase
MACVKPAPPSRIAVRDRANEQEAGTRSQLGLGPKGRRYGVSALAVNAPAGRDFDPLRDKSYRDTALGRHVGDWLAWLDLAGRAQETIDQYERDMAKLCLLYPTLDIHEIQDGELSHFIRTYTVKQRRVRLESVKSFFRWAYLQRRIDANPCDRLPPIKREAKPLIEIFSEAERDALTGLPLVDGVLMLLLFDTGIRKGEARHLRVKHLKLNEQKLLVMRGKGGKPRAVPMTKRLTQALAELILLEGLEPSDYLWYDRPGGGVGRSFSPAAALEPGRTRRVKPIVKSSFHRWWERCLDEADVKYRKPHTTRHTYATVYLRKGGRLERLSEILGHASIQTTADLYAHLDFADLAEDVALLEKVPN